MGAINIDPKVISTLSLYLADIQRRTQLNRAETQRRGRQVILRIEQEVSARRRRVKELTEACERARRNQEDCSGILRRLEAAKRELERALQARRSAEAAFRQFCTTEAILDQRLGQFVHAGKSTLNKLMGNLEDYSAFAGLVSAGALAGTGRTADPPAVTGQSYQPAKAGKRDILVFDHPAQSAKNAVIRQGSAQPQDFQGTCGLCAAGSVLRKAGIDTGEGRMIDYAGKHGLCITGNTPEHNGGTSGLNLTELLQGCGGLSSQCRVGQSLEQLAGEIEQGRGVIIGIDPTLLNPDWYGPYDPNNNFGHWVVLESVVRDANTKEILGFVLIDSNGKTPAEACQPIPRSSLETAYAANGAVAVSTDEIIW